MWCPLGTAPSLSFRVSLTGEEGDYWEEKRGKA